MGPLKIRSVVLLASVVYLAAAVVPCPTPGLERGHVKLSSADEPAQLQAPCPCGCDHRPAARPGSGKLAPVLPSTAEDEAPTPDFVAALAATPALPRAPGTPPDPIPI